MLADLTGYLNAVFYLARWFIRFFLLNSFVVSGWPDYEINVYSVGTKRPNSELIVRKNLAAVITMVFYSQSFNELRFHLHNSKVHSGFLYEKDKYEKILNSGKANQSVITAEITSNRTINNLNTLAGKINAESVSEFAAGMLEGTPAVQFKIENGG